MGTDSRSFLCCFNLSSALLDLWSFAIASLTGRFACSVDLSKAFSDFSSARLLNIDLLLEEYVGSLQSSILNYPVEFFLWISSISSISLWFWLYCVNRFLQSLKKKFNQTFKYLLKEHLLILLRLQVFWVKVHQELESQDGCNAAWFDFNQAW